MKALNALVRHVRTALGALGLFLCACSSEPPASAPGTGAAAGATVAKAQPPAAGTESNLSAPKSVFMVSSSSRDPFFPKSKRSAPVVTAPTVTEAAAPLDIPSLLQQNFHGVVSSAGQRIAVINNVVLETGRTAVIPIRAGGQTHEISVKCREVAKDSVVLEVQGYGSPIRISRTAQ